MRPRRINGQARHLGDSRSQDRRHAGAARRAGRGNGRISLHHLDPVGIEAEPVGQDLRQRRAVALSVLLLRGDDENRSVFTEPHIDAAVGAAAALFKIHADAEPAKHAPPFGIGPARREALIIGTAKRLFHQFRHLAAVDGAALDHAERYLVGADQVAASHLRPVDTDMRGDMVHQPLHDVIRLRTTGAAIGIDRRRVRHHAEDTQARRLDPVIRRQRAASRQGRDIGAEIRQPGPHVRAHGDGQRVHLAVAVDDGAGLRPVVAAVKVRQERIGACLLPAQLAA